MRKRGMVCANLFSVILELAQSPSNFYMRQRENPITTKVRMNAGDARSAYEGR